VTRDSPVVAVRLAVEGAPPTIQPGVEYWVAAHLGTNSGVGVIIIRGVIGGSQSVQETPSVYGPTAPNPYPAAGGASGTNSGGVGVVYSQTTKVATGSICGTFLCGQKVCGQVEWTVPFSARPVVILGGGIFQTFSVPPVVVQIAKPVLTLLSRSFLFEAQQKPQFGKPVLELLGRETKGEPMIFVAMGMPRLELGGRAFLPSISSTPALGKPYLELLGRSLRARIPALIPTEEVDWDLVPVTEVDFSPTPALEEDLLLMPTTEAVG